AGDQEREVLGLVTAGSFNGRRDPIVETLNFPFLLKRLSKGINCKCPKGPNMRHKLTGGHSPGSLVRATGTVVPSAKTSMQY
ncbi:MAG: hypothetical protein ACTH8J_14640, partial [Specibacter sp.]